MRTVRPAGQEHGPGSTWVSSRGFDRQREPVLQRWLDQVRPLVADRHNESAVMVVRLDNYALSQQALDEWHLVQLMDEFISRVRKAIGSACDIVQWTPSELVCLPRAIEDLDCMRRLAPVVRASLERPLSLAGLEIVASAAIGAVRIDHRTPDPVGKILERLDQALERAVRIGEGRFAVYDHRCKPLAKQAARNRLRLHSALRRAIEKGELHLAYQPIVDLPSERVVGLEALARWTDERLGEVPPSEFIRAAEEAGLIDRLEKWVINTACQQLRQWRALGYFELMMSVNVSSNEFGTREFRLEAPILEALKVNGLPAAALQIEIAETALCKDSERTMLRSIHRMSRLGIRFVIDHFGTGYSSLSRLCRLPVQGIKIHRSFVSGLPGSANSRKVVSAIVALSRTLGLEVTVEGIERHAQRQILADLGCEHAQGYLFGRPLLAEDVPSRLEDHSGRATVHDAETPELEGCRQSVNVTATSGVAN